MSHRWHYVGDINLENGGYFWREDDADDYVCVVDVTPCNDAGGPGNLFHVETGSVFLPVNDRESLSDAVDCFGWKLTGKGDIVMNDGENVRKGCARWRAIVVDACKTYHGMERDTFGGCTVVQIGKDEGPFVSNGWSPNPDVILRGNAKLENYVRREFLD